MWITRVSIANPVFAAMVMVALCVLGVFSYQRLKVDQFPNIDFPVVVVTVDYPGASPEIVESEVTKKIEEGVNSIAGINALTSRSYEGTAVVIIEFQLHIDGRKAAEDVREKVATVRPNLRTEVKEPRVLRFDPASRPVWSRAVLPDGDEATRQSAQAVDGRCPLAQMAATGPQGDVCRQLAAQFGQPGPGLARGVVLAEGQGDDVVVAGRRCTEQIGQRRLGAERRHGMDGALPRAQRGDLARLPRLDPHDPLQHPARAAAGADARSGLAWQLRESDHGDD